MDTEKIRTEEYHKKHLGGEFKKGVVSAMSKLSSHEKWIQPFQDARGTVKGCGTYDIENAREDAMKLQKAMKGQVDKGIIVEISGSRTFEQRQMIAHEYVNLDMSEKHYLIKDLKTLGGDLESLVVPLFMMPGEFDARLMEKAMHGIGTDVELLNEILCTRTTEEIIVMKKAWQEFVDPKQKLEERVGEETKKLFGVSYYNTLCLKLLEATRPHCCEPDEKLVYADAQELNRLLLERSTVNNYEGRFVEVFTERSWPHIRYLSDKFETVSNKWTLEGAIKEGFGTSNNGKGLMAIEEFSSRPYDFWARRLRDAMKGFTTDHTKLIRIIVTRSEIDLANIVQVFGQRYGEGKILRSWIEEKTSGYYCQLLLKLCGFY